MTHQTESPPRPPRPVLVAMAARWWSDGRLGALCGATACPPQAGINAWVGHGPGEDITVLAIDPLTPTTLYARTGTAGIFKTTDGGTTCRATGPGPAETGVPDVGVFALAIDPTVPTTIYAATSAGLFKTVDGGSPWRWRLGEGVHSVAIDPQASTTVYAGTHSGLYRSNDNGSTWGAIRIAEADLAVSQIAITPTTPATLYAFGPYPPSPGIGCPRGGCGPAEWFLKSTDGGATWGTALMGYPTYAAVKNVVIDPVTPTTLYAAATGIECCETYIPGGVFKSTDAGATWIDAGLADEQVLALAVDPVTPTTIYAGTRSGVFESTDGGTTWHELNTGLTARDVRALAIDPTMPQRLYAGTCGGGVFAMYRVATCPGDCFADGAVTVEETLLLVNIAQGDASIVTCGSGDGNGDGAITIDEIIAAVTSVLEGCTVRVEEATIAELQAAMGARRATAVDLVDAYLDRIESIDRQGPTLRAVIEVNPDARTIAQALDAERFRHGSRGPLHGIPVLLKDNIDTGDRMLTTAGSLALVGVLARTVADAATVLDALVGPDPRDPATQASVGHFPEHCTDFLDADGLRTARLGIPRQVFFGKNAESDAITEAAIDVLRAGGATIVAPADVPTAAALARSNSEFRLLLFEFKADLNAYLPTRPGIGVATLADLIAFNTAHADSELALFGQDIFELANLQGALDSPAYLSTLASGLRLSRDDGLDAVLDQYQLDALVAPTGPPPWGLEPGHADPGIPYPLHAVAARAGYPAITVPAGFANGLPVGVSFVGRAFGEPTLIRLAYAFEQATHARQVPQFLPSVARGPGGERPATTGRLP